MYEVVSAIPVGLKLKVLVPILITLCSVLNLESKTLIWEWFGTSTLAKWDIVFTKLLPFPTTL